ncbi:MAG: paraquat-inducible protein A [Aureispira sp.]|nr:paraquat-inducible protein A [Aureispira sp.]
MSRNTLIVALSLYVVSLVFFVLGLMYPIMGSEILLGLKEEMAYLFGSVTHFYREGDYFIGTLILLFSIVFPILKYLLVGLRIAQVQIVQHKRLTTILDIISKWAMLDVFVVALVIVNMKFDSLLIKTYLEIGTTFFALSILLLMCCTLVLKYQTKADTV